MLVVFLGNPGEKYKKTWHNAGWIIADEIVPNKEDWLFNKYAQADFSKLNLGGKEIEFIKPQTFMNNSGLAVRYVMDKQSMSPEDIIVVYDDLDLPIGSLKISHNRGDGGHNGIKSIINQTGSSSFIRVRIGIAPKEGRTSIFGDFSDYVLRSIDEEYFETIKDMSSTIKDIISSLAQSGVENTMNKFN